MPWSRGRTGKDERSGPCGEMVVVARAYWQRRTVGALPRMVVGQRPAGNKRPKRNKLIAFLRRGAPLARREERTYRGYASDEQRSERGWIGAGRPVYFAPDAERARERSPRQRRETKGQRHQATGQLHVRLERLTLDGQRPTDQTTHGGLGEREEALSQTGLETRAEGRHARHQARF